jgi:1,4-alpha-glucan branching enzyme
MYGYMWGHPGKKLLFMGGEIAQWREWNHDTSLDWHLLAHRENAGVQAWVKDLNRVLTRTPALHTVDFASEGFAWVSHADDVNSVISFLRYARHDSPPVLVVCNLTPVPRYGYRLGVPRAGEWREVLNSDSTAYGGSGMGNLGAVMTEEVSAHEHPQSLVLTLPPLAALYLLAS